MAVCERGYLCEVCGREVEQITDSDLYLRYVLGEVDPETLHLQPERHLRCNPVLAQFIADDDFEPVTIDGPFAKTELAPEFVAEEQHRVSRGYRRLKEVRAQGVPILQYPLPEFRERWRGRSPTARAADPARPDRSTDHGPASERHAGPSPDRPRTP